MKLYYYYRDDTNLVHKQAMYLDPLDIKAVAQYMYTSDSLSIDKLMKEQNFTEYEINNLCYIYLYDEEHGIVTVGDIDQLARLREAAIGMDAVNHLMPRLFNLN